MRLVTMVAVAIVAVSTAALAQVARTPVEQKGAATNAATASNDGATATANVAVEASSAAGNDPGTPAAAKTEPAAPPR